jgi:hypothetical protein
MLLQRHPFVGIQIEEVEQNDASNASGGSMQSLGMLGDGMVIRAHKLIQKHLKEDKISGLVASSNNHSLTISRTHGQLRHPREGDRLR